MLYPQHGDRIVAIDSVTSLHPMYYSCNPELRCLTAVITADHQAVITARFRYAGQLATTDTCLLQVTTS